MQKFIYIFILKRYKYKSDTVSMDINTGIDRIIKLYDRRSKILQVDDK